MWLKNCPSSELLLETITIPNEMGRWDLLTIKAHVFRCKSCQKGVARLKMAWSGYFQPEPEIASSLLKVYARLQRDETLILKGWKLSDFRSQRPSIGRQFLQSWGFPTAIAVALGIFAVIFSPAFREVTQEESQLAAVREGLPLSPIRVRDRNSVKVHYVQPELLHSMEFETGLK